MHTRNDVLVQVKLQLMFHVVKMRSWWSPTGAAFCMHDVVLAKLFCILHTRVLYCIFSEVTVLDWPA